MLDKTGIREENLNALHPPPKGRGLMAKKINKDVLMKILIAITLTATLFGGCAYVNKRLGLKNDHIGEQALEQVIKHYTGIDQDLTPGDPDD
ncbi:MAG: hypothetical protein ABFQ95_01155 [Pseudomonadota bacterium]